jgi:hypothetical protein
MTPSGNHATRRCGGFEVRFVSLYSHGRGFAFPCRSDGSVDLDAASEQVRNNYFFARAMIGREFAWPTVCEAAH